MRNLSKFTQLVTHEINLFKFRYCGPEPVFLVTKICSFSGEIDSHALTIPNKIKTSVRKYLLVCGSLINDCQKYSSIEVLP